MKNQAIDNFQQTPGSLPVFAPDVRQLYTRYRLVRPDSTVPVNEGVTLDEANIRDNEIFLLSTKRTNPLNSTDNLHGPTEDDIRVATKDIPTSDAAPPRVDINELVLQSDVSVLIFFYCIWIA